eukprot:1349290-Amorphochlora_amoeboformis.AAC.1
MLRDGEDVMGLSDIGEVVGDSVLGLAEGRMLGIGVTGASVFATMVVCVDDGLGNDGKRLVGAGRING